MKYLWLPSFWGFLFSCIGIWQAGVIRWFQCKRDHFKYHVSPPTDSQGDAGGCGNKSESAMAWNRASGRQELPNTALLDTLPFPQSGGSKELWEGETSCYTKALGWVISHGSQDVTDFSKAGIHPSFFHQMALKSLEASTTHQLRRASAVKAGQSHLPWAPWAPFQPPKTGFGVNGKFTLALRREELTHPINS